VKAVDASTLTLDSGFRDRLDDVAHEQYLANQASDLARAREIRKSLLPDVRAIGAGAGRIVYPLPSSTHDGGRYERYVVKFARPNDRYDWDGRDQNKRETRLWRNNNHTSLIPVVSADPRGYWIVMPRGESVREEANEITRWIEGISEELASNLLDTDLSPKNVVRLDGQLRLCDYGVPTRGHSSPDSPS
jgi:hypothetical protein